MIIRLLVLFIVLLAIACGNDTIKNTLNKQGNDSIQKQVSSPALPKVMSDTANGGFTSYWKTFRTAVMNWDTTQIMNLSKFPFQTRGQSDEDATIFHTKQQFIRILRAFLQQWDGEKINSGTELEGIRKTESIERRDVQVDMAYVGNNMIFYKEDNEWKPAKIFFNKKTIAHLKKQIL